jgi:hypothetical protein
MIEIYESPEGRSKEDAAFMSLLENVEAKEFGALLQAWGAIKDKQVRGALLHLVRCMADLSS